MDIAANTFTSAFLQRRDKAAEEKHQKEVSVYLRRIERLRSSYDAAQKEIFDVTARADRLALSLGFNNFHEAQVAIDTADHELSYKDCLERVEELENRLSAEEAKNYALQEQIRVLEEERKQLHVAAERSLSDARGDATRQKSIADRLSKEIAQLEARYDALADAKERAAERYKVDYAKWRKFRDWLFKEEEEQRNNIGISEEEKKKQSLASITRKRKMMMEIGPRPEGDHTNPSTPYPPPPPLGGITNVEDDKENQATPVPDRKRRRLTETPKTSSRPSPIIQAIKISPSSAPNVKSLEETPSVRNPLPRAVLRPMPPSSSPSVGVNARQPLVFLPIAQRGPQIASPPPTLHISRPPKRQFQSPTMSSDTEDDSQAVEQFLVPVGTFKVPMSPVAMNSSQTEPESQSQISPFSESSPPQPLPPRSIFPQSHPSDSKMVSRDAESLQPLKIRPSSDPAPSLTLVSKTPKPWKQHTTDTGGSSEGRRDKAKGTPAPISTPSTAGPGGQKRLDDYSAFKGRGRYAKDAGRAKDSINAQYVIDPARNGGLDFQYDEVVRRKDDRRQMDAGDCECCRDYYEAVGPLPSRLKAPLWRSPPTTPVKPCARHQHLSASASKVPQSANEARQSEITSHRQAISRHRHHWARAKTPPGYWNIGFPDTQEAEDINEQAREMHAKKRAEVDAAAKRGDGRYKKR